MFSSQGATWGSFSRFYWKSGALFPALQDRVLSMCSDAQIYLDHGTCSPFQRWQSALVFSCWLAQNARGVVKGVVKGVTRASVGRRAPRTPLLKRASAGRRKEKVFRGVYMIQQVAAVHLGWGQTPSLDTKMT